MKKGQNTNYEKPYFNSGMEGHSRDVQEILNRFLNQTEAHKKAKNIARKKKKRK